MKLCSLLFCSALSLLLVACGGDEPTSISTGSATASTQQAPACVNPIVVKETQNRLELTSLINTNAATDLVLVRSETFLSAKESDQEMSFLVAMTPLNQGGISSEILCSSVPEEKFASANIEIPFAIDLASGRIPQKLLANFRVSSKLKLWNLISSSPERYESTNEQIENKQNTDQDPRGKAFEYATYQLSDTEFEIRWSVETNDNGKVVELTQRSRYQQRPHRSL